MDFDLERLQDIVSPYIILLKRSDVIHVSDALASRIGISKKDHVQDYFRQDSTLLESLGSRREKIHLPVKGGKDLLCSCTDTSIDDIELLALTEAGLPGSGLSQEAASKIYSHIARSANRSFLIVEKGHIVHANKEFGDLIGCDFEDVLGRQVISFISRQSRQTFIKTCDEGFDDPGRMIASCGIIFTSSSGKRIHAEISGGWDSHGEHVYLWLEAVNTTEKVRLERALKEEQRKSSELFDLSPIGLLYISPRGIILDSNEFVSNLMHYSKEEIKGSAFTKFVVPHEEQRLRDDFRTLFLQGSAIHRQECLLRTKHGQDVTIEYNVQVITRKGRRVKALMVFSDITGKKDLEMELLEKNAEMEKTLWEMAEVKDALEARAGELMRATEELKVLNEKLNQLSITDGLTEIYNHRHFQDRLGEEVERVDRAKEGVVSLLFLDIDEFKRFNDTYGHQCGDMVLRQLAGILKNSVRHIDILARYGGEEFAVILPNAKAEEGALVGRRICEAVRSTPFYLGEGTSARVTVSIGVGTHTHGQGEKAGLIRKADNALYAAKAKGKDRVEVWEDD